MPGISASWAPWAGTPMQRRNRPMNEPISDEGQEQTVMRMLLDTPLVQRQGDPDAGDFSKGFRDYGSQNFTLGNMLEDGAAGCLLYTSPNPRDRTRSRMPSSA